MEGLFGMIECGVFWTGPNGRKLYGVSGCSTPNGIQTINRRDLYGVVECNA